MLGYVLEKEKSTCNYFSLIDKRRLKRKKLSPTFLLVKGF